MPVPTCPRKDSEQGLILQGIKCQSAPSSHVRKIKSCFGILVNLPSHNVHKNYKYTYEYIHMYMCEKKMQGIRQICRKYKWKKNIYIFDVDEDLLFIYH